MGKYNKKKSKKRHRPLAHLFRKTPPLGGSTAEKEEQLSRYYARRERYVDPVLQSLPGLHIHTGPKGSGKSAIQSAIQSAIEQEWDNLQPVVLRPGDIKLWSIIETHTIAKDFDPEHQFWVNRTLWEYLISVEILRFEYPEQESLGDKIRSLFSIERRAVMRLIKRIYNPSSGESMANRFVSLIKDLEINVEYKGTKAGVKLTKDESNLGQNTSSLLHTLNSITKKLDEFLKDKYIVLIDDLDMNWTGEKQHRHLIEGLVAAVHRITNISKKVSFAIAIREDIYQTLQIADKDKIRDRVTEIVWSPEDIEVILEKRLSWACPSYRCKGRILDHIFAEGCKKRDFSRVSDRLPRRAIQTLELAITYARNEGKSKIDNETLARAVAKASCNFLDDVLELNRYTFRELKAAVLLLRGLPRESSLQDFWTHLRTRAEKTALPEWFHGMCTCALSASRFYLKLGLLDYKSGRKSPARKYNEETDYIDDSIWVAVAPTYAPCLGIV